MKFQFASYIPICACLNVQIGIFEHSHANSQFITVLLVPQRVQKLAFNTLA